MNITYKDLSPIEKCYFQLEKIKLFNCLASDQLVNSIQYVTIDVSSNSTTTTTTPMYILDRLDWLTDAVFKYVP